MRLAVALLMLLPAVAHADPLSMRFGWCIDATDPNAVSSQQGVAEDVALGKIEGGAIVVRKCLGFVAHYGPIAPATLVLWSDPKSKRIVRQVLGEETRCYELRAKGWKRTVIVPMPELDAEKPAPAKCTQPEVWTFDPALRWFTSKKDQAGTLRAFQRDLDDGDLALARGRLVGHLEDDPGVEWQKRFLEAANRIANAKWKAGAKTDAAGIALATLYSEPFASFGTVVHRDSISLPVDAWSIQLMNDLAFFAAEGGAPQHAIPFLERIIAADPARAVAHLNLADALRDTGDMEKAAASYARYVALMDGAKKSAKVPPRARKPTPSTSKLPDAATLARAAIERKDLEVARGWLRATHAGVDDLLAFLAAACATGDDDVIRAAYEDRPISFDAATLPEDDPRRAPLTGCPSR